MELAELTLVGTAGTAVLVVVADRRAVQTAQVVLVTLLLLRHLRATMVVLEAAQLAFVQPLVVVVALLL